MYTTIIYHIIKYNIVLHYMSQYCFVSYNTVTITFHYSEIEKNSIIYICSRINEGILKYLPNERDIMQTLENIW